MTACFTSFFVDVFSAEPNTGLIESPNYAFFAPSGRADKLASRGLGVGIRWRTGTTLETFPCTEGAHHGERRACPTSAGARACARTKALENGNSEIRQQGRSREWEHLSCPTPDPPSVEANVFVQDTFAEAGCRDDGRPLTKPGGAGELIDSLVAAPSLNSGTSHTLYGPL